jgi:hypothetical protein
MNKEQQITRNVIARNRERSAAERSNPEKTVTKNWIASLTLAMTKDFTDFFAMTDKLK